MKKLIFRIFLFYENYFLKRKVAFMNKFYLSMASIGENVKFLGKGTVFNPENLIIGANCRIGNNFFIHAKGKVTIGEGTIISRNVCIYSCNHDFKSHTHIPYDNHYLEKEVIIGKAVWIGMNVNITPGVVIGDGAIIGMGSTISKDVPSNAIVVSGSQRIVGSRDDKESMDLILKQSYFAKDFPNL